MVEAVLPMPTRMIFCRAIAYLESGALAGKIIIVENELAKAL